MLDFVYPHFYALEEMDLQWGNGEEFIQLPKRLPLTGANLSHDGIFLLTGPEGLSFIVGKSISPSLCQRVFDTSALVNSTYASSVSLVETDDPFVNRIHAVLFSLREMYGEHLQAQVILRGEKEMNVISRCFRDDRCGSDPSLSEFVCEFFKKVLAKYK